MADVDDRGQLLLVGALTLAVMLVALAVLLNAAIYTGNVATRDAGTGAGEAIEYENEATTMAQSSIDAAEGSNYSEVRGNFTDSVQGWSELAHTHSGASLAATNLTTVDLTNGSRIAQQSDRNFTDDNGNSNWTVAGDSHARAFRMNVTQGSLRTGATDAFQVTFDDGTDEWGIYLYQDGGNVSITVEDETDTEVGDGCTVDPGTDDRAIVDVTGGTLAGQECPEMQFFENLSGAYTIGYVDALNGSGNEQVNGTYSLVVDRQQGSLVTGADEDAGAPTVAPALYSADLSVTYRAADLLYQSEFRVAPGEAGDDD
ncbi:MULTISPECIES: DUF7261 family protein [Halolamina]|uniref:Uncharacterized protein n=1 Tax=Halolamina pelagica TaxID=699431 RepID=A0A1I5MZA8_9EURY|nr:MULTISPECIES: hypothetical protein [Halolamina]NHX36229.1 hypothetical protein [Halolamina sp. R1-12]SFP14789.1 hypothetical protein SAMN05216277_101475 [Halolamina pelagica]